VKLPSGEALLKGKTVTGFSNNEEEIYGFIKKVPVLLESRLNEVGATYVKADEPWGPKVYVDGNIITGQNPSSGKPFGEAIAKALGQSKSASTVWNYLFANPHFQAFSFLLRSWTSIHVVYIFSPSPLLVVPKELPLRIVCVLRVGVLTVRRLSL